MRATLAIALLLTAGISPACESVPLVAPSQSTVRLVVADTSIPNGGSTTVTAIVTEAAGTPVHDGTVVTFSTTLGDMHPPEAPTRRGSASATLTAGAESGTADVVAYSGGAVSEAVLVLIGAAAVGNVHVTAEPGSLPPAGGTTTLVATVLDGAHNPLPNVSVAFAASAGTLRDRVVATDRSGEARTSLTTTTRAEVTATAGGVSGTTSISIDPVTAISIRSTPARPVAGQVVSFEVTLRNAARAIRSASIDFGDGRIAELGPAAQTTVAHAYGAVGAYTVTVSATDAAGHVSSSTLVIQVDPAPDIPVAISVSPAAPLAGQAVTFTVEVSPPTNAPAVRDVAIDFGDESTTSLGALTGRTSIAHVYRRDGSYIVTVRVLDAADRRHTSSIGVQVRAAPGIPVAITVNPAVPVKGQAVTFTVTVSPPAGASAVRDVTIDFGDESSTSLGALTGRGSAAHVYREAGSYIVTATVLDATGRRHFSSIGIVVSTG